MKKFLIIEDDKSMRTLYSVLLTHYFKNPTIRFSYNGDEALTELSNSNYDLIISDINMEVMDGVTFHRKLKEVEPLLADRVIFMTSSTSGPHIRYIKNKSLPFLFKPFKIKDFYSILTSAFALQKNKEINTRKHRRFSCINSCIIETRLNTVSHGSRIIEAESVDYSAGGMGIRYSGERIDHGECVRVFAEAIKISEREARVVWTSDNNEGIRHTGLQWVLP